MLEKNVQGLIGKRISENGGFIHKISDMDIRCCPFDFFAVIHGEAYFCELKHCKGTALPFSSIAEHQLAGLERVDGNSMNIWNIKALLVISIEKDGKLIAVKEIGIEALLNKIDHGTRKSLSMKEMMDLPDFKLYKI